MLKQPKTNSEKNMMPDVTAVAIKTTVVPDPSAEKPSGSADVAEALKKPENALRIGNSAEFAPGFAPSDSSADAPTTDSAIPLTDSATPVDPIGDSDSAMASTPSDDGVCNSCSTDSAGAGRRLHLPSEVAYFVAILLIAISVSMTVTAGFGVSMIVAPAYLVSEKLSFLTFGTAEYILQGILFIIFCIAVRRFRPVYLSSFLTCLIYGLVLDLVRRAVPLFHAAPETVPVPLRVVLLLFGMVLTSFSVALFFKIYLYPQVYDFFVVGIVARYRLREGRFKTLFDLSMLALSLLLSFLLFGRLTGIGWGTVAMALLNGSIIGFFSRLLDRTVRITPLFPRFAKYFEI